MPESRCRLCNKRPIWRDRNNNIGVCKRCYHRVWNETRQNLRGYRTAITMLERGEIPELLGYPDTPPQDIAAELVDELQQTAWATGAKQEVAPLIARCEALIRQARDISE